jgi:HSP20 family protein
MLPTRVFNDFFDLDVTEKGNCDIYQEDGKYHLEMDLPGYRKEDIHLETNKGSIIVSARKEEKKEEKEGKRYIRRERTFGKVDRSFYIGDIDEDNISAEFKDGILKVVIPTKVETEKKQISIK